MNRNILILGIALILSSCSNVDRVAEKEFDYSASMAVLYSYYSSEYKALTIQAFNLAENRILEISQLKNDVSNLAVVVDIDETVLDNSPYQARAIVENFAYPDGWNEWCNEAIASPVPGSLDFLNLADSLGFKIFYVSNRKEEFVYEGTVKNLVSEGFPQVMDKSIMLRKPESVDNPDPSDKTARRTFIRDSGYEIVLLAGDNLGDFYADTLKGSFRDDEVLKSADRFGDKYIVLPNAMYGNWPAAIGLDGSQKEITSLLKQMSKR